MCLIDAVYICNMKKVRVLSLLLTAALTVTSLTVAPSEADAAKKKVSLAKKKVTVAVGQTKKIKIVPAKKKKAKGSAVSSKSSKKNKIKAKVKWKSSNKNIAKVVKKKVFVKKANARVKGVAPGTAVVKAVYKRKGVKATLKCKVTVVPAGETAGSAAPSQSASVSAAPASNAPATDQPGPDKTARPTKGPTPEPTATPTRNPNTQPPASPNPWPENADSYSFDLAAPREEGGIYSVQDGATWEKNADGSITVTFNKDKDYPDMSFRIPAKYYKTDYYKWVEIKYSDNEGNRGLSIYDKGLLPDHDTAPWECDATTKYDLGPDFLPEYAGDCVKIIALDELEDWTEYATQIDIYAPTVEGGKSAGGKITIKSITLYSDQPGEVTPTKEPVATERNLKLSEAKNMGGTVESKEDELLTLKGADGVLIPIGEPLDDGEEIEVTVYGTATASGAPAKVRAWLSDTDAHRWSEIVNPITFEETFKLKASSTIDGDGGSGTDTCKHEASDYIQFKKEAYNSPAFDELTITKVVVKKVWKTLEPGTYVPVEPEVSEEAIGAYEVPINADNLKADGPSTVDFANGVANLTVNAMYGGLWINIPADKQDEYSRVEVEYENGTGGFGYGCQYTDSTQDENLAWGGLLNGSGVDKKDFDAGRTVTKFKYFNNGESLSAENPAKVTIKSIKLFKADAKTLEVSTFETETSGNVSLDSTTGYGNVRIDDEKFNEFLDYYSDMYNALNDLSGKATPEEAVTKYMADGEEITYTPSEAGKGTITFTNGEDVNRSLDVEIKQGETADDLVATFTDENGKVKEVKVSKNSGNECDVTMNGEEGYKLVVTDSEDSYSVVFTAPDGEYIKLVKEGNKYTLKATKAMIEKYGLSLSYLPEEA